MEILDKFNIYIKKNKIKNESETSKIEKNDDSENIRIIDIVTVLIIAITLSTLFLHFFRFATVDGISMQNTLYDGEKLLINVNAYDNEKIPKYKDIVVIKRDDLSCKYLVKRVIGTAGDKISIVNNDLYINNKKITENYIKETMNTEDMSITIPNGYVFVMGDNRNNSLDSRSNVIGLVNIKDEIFGKAIFNISKISKINN